MDSPEFYKLLMSIRLGEAYVSLRELMEMMELDPKDLLSSLSELSDKLRDSNIHLLPTVRDEDNLEIKRKLYTQDYIESSAKIDLSNEESLTLEFKSSLTFDHKRYEYNPELDWSKCHKEELIHSVLKTISAFLNTAGGTLYVGVDDDGQVLGLKFDFSNFKHDRQNFDMWELRLRDLIKSKFYEGESINAFIRIDPITIENEIIAKITVSVRGKLSFVREGLGQYQAFTRQGNRTWAIEPYHIQEFLENWK